MHLTGIILLIFNFVRVYAKFRLNVDQKTLSTASSAVNYPSNSLANYQTFSSLKHTGYSVRFVRPTLCDSDLQQYSGYLDLGQDVHYYFWFFESKKEPASKPLTRALARKWALQGGEEHDEHRLQSLQLDTGFEYAFSRPGTGFSYGAKMNIARNSQLFYDAIQLFYEAFPQYSPLPFHLFGESFAGRYIPVYSDYIVKRNKQEVLKIPIESIGIGNGWINPLIQFQYGSTMACDSSYGQLLSQLACDRMKKAYVTCSSLVKKCYEKDSALSCVRADNYCTNNIDGVFSLSKRSYYDVRKEEDVVEPPQDFINLLNQPDMKRKIGAADMLFEECADAPYVAISSTGESARQSSTAFQILLKIAGLFTAQSLRSWNYQNKEVGQIQMTNRLAFVRVYEAGHEVPYYQPEVALAMFDNWVNKKPF
ncbi:hypothetical protein G6F36_005367 [Rhizopus arrhizus]|nr:hypothetical protein G6F36_005367 [Rhizopus arrhizus]